MTHSDKQITDLIAHAHGRCDEWSDLTNAPTDIFLIAELTDALETEHQRAESYFEGLYNVYVQLGEDTDGARNARALFGPMTQTDPAEWLPRLVRANRCEWEDEAETLEAERDALRAVIQPVLDAWNIPGIQPDYHEWVKAKLLDEWLPLYQALLNLSRAIDTKEKS